MKGVAAALKGAIPRRFRRALRQLKRAFVPYRSNPQNDQGLLSDATEMVAKLQHAGAKLSGSTVVEIGSGWVPMLPLVFRMAGAREVITIDQERLMDRHTFRYAASFVRDELALVASRAGRELPLFDTKLLQCRPDGRLEDLCRDAGITYLAPGDFMDMGTGIADLIVSRTVLEHVPEDALRRIFLRAATVIRPGGLMCHWIDMSDHFEHRNKSLSRLDMLQYSDQEWSARTRDPQDYQNRLRRFDYVRLLAETGWEIIKLTGEPNLKALEDLRGMNLMPRYANVSPDELSILTSMIIARPAAERSTL